MKCNHDGLAGLDECLECRIAELEAERETWGNEFSAVIMMKEQVAGLESMLIRINEHVFPGSSDSIDGLKRLVRERDQYYTEAKRQAEIIQNQTGEILNQSAYVAELEKLLKIRGVAVDNLQQMNTEQAERVSQLEKRLKGVSEECLVSDTKRYALKDENARLREALERMLGLTQLGSRGRQVVEEALQSRQGVDEKSGVLEDNRERGGSLRDAVKQREVQSLHPGSTTVQAIEVDAIDEGTKRFIELRKQATQDYKPTTKNEGSAIKQSAQEFRVCKKHRWDGPGACEPCQAGEETP